MRPFVFFQDIFAEYLKLLRRAYAQLDMASRTLEEIKAEIFAVSRKNWESFRVCFFPIRFKPKRNCRLVPILFREPRKIQRSGLVVRMPFYFERLSRDTLKISGFPIYNTAFEL